MGKLEHIGDIDTSIDHYEITAIDRETKTVLVNFAHNGHGLHHSVFVEDVEDVPGILQAVREHYERYKADVEKAHAERKPLPDEIHALIGQKYMVG